MPYRGMPYAQLEALNRDEMTGPMVLLLSSASSDGKSKLGWHESHGAAVTCERVREIVEVQESQLVTPSAFPLGVVDVRDLTLRIWTTLLVCQ